MANKVKLDWRMLIRLAVAEMKKSISETGAADDVPPKRNGDRAEFTLLTYQNLSVALDGCRTREKQTGGVTASVKLATQNNLT